MRGIIIKGVGGLYTVMSDNLRYECSARGRFRKKGMMTPIVGDYVEIEKADDSIYAIDKIYDRKNELIRPNVSNIDQLIITFAAAKPEPDLLLADKLTVEAARQNIEAVICITKSDIKDASAYREIYENAGFKTIVTGLGAEDGQRELDEVTKGKVTAIAGCSGVGKSTLINAMCDGLSLKTGSVSRKTEHGRHTTRHAELLPLENGGYIADTPGFSAYEVDSGGCISDYFREFLRFPGCRFSDCTHISEPDCQVKEALAEGKISQSRYENYIKIFNEQSGKERYR